MSLLMPCPRRLNYSLGFIYFYFCGMLSENKQANKKNQRQHVQLCWKPCTGRPNPARNLRRAERRLAARESDRKVLNGCGGGKMAAAVESSRGQEATGEEAASGNRGAAVTGGGFLSLGPLPGLSPSPPSASCSLPAGFHKREHPSEVFLWPTVPAASLAAVGFPRLLPLNKPASRF